MIRKLFLMALAATLATGCAVRLGGPGPVEYRTVALSSAADAPPAQVAGYIRESGANVVLLAAPADSAWFAAVAQSANLSLSGPGKAGGMSLAFLAGKAVGDTTLSLPLEGGGSVVLHDALYKVDKYRHLDLLALRVGPGVEARMAVQALLRYVATDVMSDAAVVLAIDVPDAATGEAVAQLLDPAFLDARTCLPEELRGGAQVSGMRLFYGPEARLRCESARLLGDQSSPVVAHLIVDR